MTHTLTSWKETFCWLDFCWCRICMHESIQDLFSNLIAHNLDGRVDVVIMFYFLSAVRICSGHLLGSGSGCVPCGFSTFSALWRRRGPAWTRCPWWTLSWRELLRAWGKASKPLRSQRINVARLIGCPFIRCVCTLQVFHCGPLQKN